MCGWVGPEFRQIGHLVHPNLQTLLRTKPYFPQKVITIPNQKIPESYYEPFKNFPDS